MYRSAFSTVSTFVLGALRIPGASSKSFFGIIEKFDSDIRHNTRRVNSSRINVSRSGVKLPPCEVAGALVAFVIMSKCERTVSRAVISVALGIYTLERRV